ncbi:MAG: hypothetical protein ACM3US_07285 [Sphingomonadaceae bacterium]
MSTVLSSGSVGADGDMSGLGAAIDSAGAGEVLELQLTLPVPWPEWIGPINVADAIAGAIRPHVQRLISVSISGNVLSVVWEA